MNKKLFYSTLCIFLALLIIFLFYIWSVSHKKNNLTKENNLIRVGYTTAIMDGAPFYVAYAKGFFSEHNVTIETVPLASGGEVKLALSAGQVDIGLAGGSNFLIPISKGVPIKIIGPMASAKTYLYVRPDNKIRTFEDLIGKTIVVSSGGSNEYEVRRILKKENIDTSKINFVNMDRVNRPTALMEKKVIDAAPIDTEEIAKYSELGAVLLEEWGAKGYSNQYTPRSVIAINEEFEDSNPQLVEKFIDALIEGHRFIKSNPEEAAETVSSYINTESGGAFVYLPENLIDIWKNGQIKYNLWFDPTILIDMSKIAVEIGQIDSNLTLDQVFDPRFEEKLKDAQNEIYSTN